MQGRKKVVESATPRQENIPEICSPEMTPQTNLPLADICFAEMIGWEKYRISHPRPHGAELGHTKRMASMCWHS